ncbi:ubiquinone anaerobic biosynthesis protein UbiU [Thioalkalivibrio paradoxus]|uniref:Ubiquinone biosynthesis protein UbiU n=1 Tax=Thioalkalivibrio paradoxus ARh 1 TaxID=713585 RepID=W0DMY4_9GAMM|nr:peptidase U32 family protein [Thioalkalivibrio paradoxus]AHE98235.1 protease [Thioalkalivibrio paradoxus ARh 1]
MELVCPAGSLPALRAAVDAGADTVYTGLKDATNARHFAGLNFTAKSLAQGVEYAHARGRRVLMAINTYPQPKGWPRWTAAVDHAAALGVDGVILADAGVLGYAADRHPDLPRHLSVQASATSAEALAFYRQQFGIRRAVLPRVLSLAQVKALSQDSDVELEVFGFGSLCIMAEGRCLLSSYATGESPNTVGACSPAAHVRWHDLPDGGLETRLNGVLIDRFQAGERAGYPTLCKGRYQVQDHVGHILEEPTSLNTLELLPELLDTGITAIKIEGRQRSPAYVTQVTAIWRAAIDRCLADRAAYRALPEWQNPLAELSEGSQTTLGAYHRPWH